MIYYVEDDSTVLLTRPKINKEKIKVIIAEEGGNTSELYRKISCVKLCTSVENNSSSVDVSSYNDDDSEQELSSQLLDINSRSGGWSRWSEWSSCSRSCDGGVAHQFRTCNMASCRGEHIKYKICNMQIFIAAIIGFANASPSKFFHGFTRTTIKGPSGTIVQETPGEHILKSFLSSKVYAPTFPGAVAVPGPVVAEPAPFVSAPSVETPLLHSVLPEPIVAAPVVPLPAPVVHDAFVHHPPAVPYVLPGSAPFPPAPVPFSPFVDSRVFPVPPFVDPALPFSAPVPALSFPAPVPVVDTRFFPQSPLYVERLLHQAPFVPAPVPVPVPAVDVHPVKTFPEIVFGKYPPAVPPTEYGL